MLVVSDAEDSPDRACGFGGIPLVGAIFGGGDCKKSVASPGGMHVILGSEGEMKVLPPGPEELGDDESGDVCEESCTRQAPPDVCWGGCAKSCRKWDKDKSIWHHWFDCCMTTSCIGQEEVAPPAWLAPPDVKLQAQARPATRGQEFRPDLSVTR